MGLAGGLNRYAYVGGNPVNLNDPNGLLARQVGNWLDTQTHGYFSDFVSVGRDTLSLPGVQTTLYGGAAMAGAGAAGSSLLSNPVTRAVGGAAATILDLQGAADGVPTVFQQTGARRVLDPNTLRGWDLADNAYASIRENASDVASISANTGWSESRVTRIKEHLFVNEHQLDLGVKRFDADPDIVNAWSRLTTGDHVPSDIDLLHHEIFEAKFEGIFKTDYRTAHDAAIRAGHTWTPE